MEDMEWKRRFADLGVFWLHDGNPERPYARLTSGLISNGFFNCGILMSEHPRIFAEAVEHLVGKSDIKDTRHTGRVIGAAKGGINLAYQIGVAANRRYAYAEKTDDGFAFDERFSQHFAKAEHFIVCEDTMTTGGSVQKLMLAALECVPRAQFESPILVVCNRSGMDRLGALDIVSLIDQPMQTWKDGENPFTSNGRELVEPVRPKTHWHELTRTYA